MINIKLKGFASPYMLGAVIGLGIISTTIGYKAKQQNAENNQKYIQQKKEYIQNLAQSLKYVVSTESTTDETVTQARLSEHVYTNAFDVNTNLEVNQVGSTAGEKTTAISLSTNKAAQKKLQDATSANILKQDLSNSAGVIHSEKNIRKEQILKSYANMKKQAGKMYLDVIASKDYVWPDSVTLYVKDSWNRDFTYTKVDDQNAQLSFNLPWNTGTTKILPVRLPAIPEAPILFPEVENSKKLLANANSYDNLGRSVSISGNFAITGANGTDDNGSSSGSAIIYKKDGANWVQDIKLLASDAADSDNFGWSVSISGDLALVGANANDDNGSSSGSAYVFRREGLNWVEETKLLPSDGAAGHQFGKEVSINGDLAIIGAPAHDNKGAAYIFRRTGTSWSEEAKLLASDAGVNDQFSESLAIDGDLAIVGAFANSDRGYNTGSAYVYRKEGANWVQEAKLLPAETISYDQFGDSVSINGNLIMVGASLNGDNGVRSGSVYVYKRDGTTWVQEAKLLPSDGANSDKFGTSLSISKDLVVVGSPADDDDGSASGSVYVYKKEGENWVEKVKLLASDADAGDTFGGSVSTSGGLAIVGADGNDDNASSAGSIYIFEPK